MCSWHIQGDTRVIGSILKRKLYHLYYKTLQFQFFVVNVGENLCAKLLFVAVVTINFSIYFLSAFHFYFNFRKYSEKLFTFIFHLSSNITIIKQHILRGFKKPNINKCTFLKSCKWNVIHQIGKKSIFVGNEKEIFWINIKKLKLWRFFCDIKQERTIRLTYFVCTNMSEYHIRE